MRPKLSFANAIALIALFVSLGGTVYAAATINGKSIRKGSIPADRLQKDSVGGAQLNEAKLDSVPRAQLAAEATRVLQADSAQSATRADLASGAQKAVEATKAAVATDSGRAKAAETARQATDADALSGIAASKFLLRENCAEETIKGAVKVEPSLTPPNAVVTADFNCASEADPTLTVVRDGEYRVSFPNLPAGIPVVTAMANGFEASVQGLPGEAAFRVTVYRSGVGGLANRPFTLAIF